MRIALMLLYILLVMPVRVRLTLSQEDFVALPYGYLHITFAGVGPLLNWNIRMCHRRAYLRLSWKKISKQLPIKRRHAHTAKHLNTSSSLLSRIKSAALHMLRGILRVRVTVALGLLNAAHTALVCGIVSALLQQIPCVHVRTLPQYDQTPSFYLHADCILSARAGKLLLTAALIAFYARHKAGGARYGREYSPDWRRYANGT